MIWFKYTIFPSYISYALKQFFNKDDVETDQTQEEMYLSVVKRMKRMVFGKEQISIFMNMLKSGAREPHDNEVTICILLRKENFKLDQLKRNMAFN